MAIKVNLWKWVQLTDEETEFGAQEGTTSYRDMNYPVFSRYGPPQQVRATQTDIFDDFMWVTPRKNLIIVARRFYAFYAGQSDGGRYPTLGGTLGGDSECVAWLVDPDGNILDKQYIDVPGYGLSFTVDLPTGTAFLSGVTAFTSSGDNRRVFCSNALVSEDRGKLSISGGGVTNFENPDVIFPAVQPGVPIVFDQVGHGATPATSAPALIDLTHRMTVSGFATNGSYWDDGYFANHPNVIAWLAQDIDTGANLWYYIQHSADLPNNTQVSLHKLALESPGTARALMSALENTAGDHLVWLQHVSYDRTGMSFGDKVRVSDLLPGGSYTTIAVELLRQLTSQPWGELYGLVTYPGNFSAGPGWLHGPITSYGTVTSSNFTPVTLETVHDYTADPSFRSHVYGELTPWTGYNNDGWFVTDRDDALYFNGYGIQNITNVQTMGLYVADLKANSLTFYPVLDYGGKGGTVGSAGSSCAVIDNRAYLTTGQWTFRNTSQGVYDLFMPGTDNTYLRMTQRDDGLGIRGHPRLPITSMPTSQQLTRAPRVRGPNTYS